MEALSSSIDTNKAFLVLRKTLAGLVTVLTSIWNNIVEQFLANSRFS